MTTKPKLLLICDSRENVEHLLGDAANTHEILTVQNPLRAIALLRRETIDGVYVAGEYLHQAFEIGKLLQNEQILEGMPDGVMLLDSDNTIIWSNNRLCRMGASRQPGRREFLFHVGESGDPGAGFLSFPHGPCHGPGDRFHAP